MRWGRRRCCGWAARGERPRGARCWCWVPQALRAVFAPLCSQFILLMLNSSIVSVISADELTAAAQDIQSRTFRSFEVYIVTIGIYLVLSVGFSVVFGMLNRLCFPKLEAR